MQWRTTRNLTCINRMLCSPTRIGKNTLYYTYLRQFLSLDTTSPVKIIKYLKFSNFYSKTCIVAIMFILY